MAEKSMIIVGAGIAGLSTGCYAQMNGFKTTIFEMHDKPGGLCAAWTRKGYTFDISMHMLVGSKSGAFHRMWQELGVLDGRQFVYHDRMVKIESGSKSLDVSTDPRRLEEQMLELSPDDAPLTREFLKLYCGRGMIGTASLKPSELASPFEKLKMLFKILPMMGKFSRYGRLTVEEFANRFKDQFLRTAVRFLIDSPGWPMPGFPLLGLAGFLDASVSQAGVPVGGCARVVETIAHRYRFLGGELRLRTRVKDVIIENNSAKGVRLADGSEERADKVVWAGDGHTLIFDILRSRFIDDAIRTPYETWMPVKPLVHVCLGVARDMSREPSRLVFEIEKPITVAGEEHTWLFVLHHSFDPTMAPAGKSAVEVWYATDYDYWQKLSSNRKRYEAEKKSVAEETITALDRRWPGFARQVEVVDVPTPHTYARYTGNWQGSPDGWYITADNMRAEPLRTLPGLANLYMVGQWTAPFTGTVIAALSGRQLIQLLCREEGRRWGGS